MFIKNSAEVLFSIILITSFVGATADIDIISPETETTFTSGDIVDIEVQSTGDIMKSLLLRIKADGSISYSNLVNQSFSEEAAVTNYTLSFDSSGFEGGYTLMAFVAWHEYDYYSTGNPFHTLYFSPSLELEGDPMVVVRNLPDFFYPGGSVGITYTILPHGDYSGLIINENLPDEIIDDLPNQDNSYTQNMKIEEDGDLFKFLIMGNPVEADTFFYSVDSPEDIEPGQELTFSGTFQVGEVIRPIIGDSTISAAGYSIPNCPITDTELLAFVEQWRSGDLSPIEDENDQIILELIEEWKSC